ncbi:MAG TPA: hypothetical protein VMU40_06520 [Steroidobacteraceae bacterium]|nr:hypothetical protein [Steroidobacteraceae bacterium]
MPHSNSSVDLRRRRLASALASLGISILGRPARAGAPARFPVFDALLHRGKPPLEREGLVRMPAIANIWRPGVSHDEVDERGVVAAVELLPLDTTHVYIDIENWPLFPADSAVLDASLRKLLRVTDIVRRARPGLLLGFYGAPPASAYWPIMFRNASYQQWLQTNRRMAPLARAVDFLLPSFYTHYDDLAGWLRFAAAQLEEARRYDKPIYPFLLYLYSEYRSPLDGLDIPERTWHVELEFCREHADGVVLWGGAGRNWSESATWWQVTRKVLHLPADPFG